MTLRMESKTCDFTNPTAVGHGEPEISLVPDGRLRVVEECGHSPMIEKPAEFARLRIASLREQSVEAERV